MTRVVLNQLGSRVWELCDGKRSVLDIVSELRAGSDFQLPCDQVLISDVCQFLSQAQDHWLILANEYQPADFLFVVPPFPSTYSPEAVKVAEYSSPPLGLCYMAAVLAENGHKVAIADMHIDVLEPGDIIRLLEKYRPRFLGISASTPTFTNAIRVARFAKAFSPELVTALGGIHPSALPDEALSESSVDLVVRGEGEEAMRELAARLADSSFEIPHDPIPGVSLRAPDGSIRHGPQRDFIDDLDSLPFPARQLVDLSKYQQPGAMISSRGCPAKCVFCSCGSFSGRKWRARSPENVVDEIEYMVEVLGIRRISFHDDTFNLSEQRLRAICELLLVRNVDVQWDCLARVTPMTVELARLMRQAGCCGIQFGIESGNQEVLRSICKGITLRQAECAVRAAVKAGIPQISCGFMLGHPADTPESIADTIEFAEHLRNLGATTLTLSLVTPYPGTPIAENASDLGIEILSDNWEDYVFSRLVAHPKGLNVETLRASYCTGLERIHAEFPPGLLEAQ